MRVGGELALLLGVQHPLPQQLGRAAAYDRDNITPPPGRFSKLDGSTTKRVPIPNDKSSESSRRDVSDADSYGTDTIPTIVEISTM